MTINQKISISKNKNNGKNYKITIAIYNYIWYNKCNETLKERYNLWLDN